MLLFLNLSATQKSFFVLIETLQFLLPPSNFKPLSKILINRDVRKARVEMIWISIDFQSIIASMRVDFPLMEIQQNRFESLDLDDLCSLGPSHIQPKRVLCLFWKHHSKFQPITSFTDFFNKNLSHWFLGSFQLKVLQWNAQGTFGDPDAAWKWDDLKFFPSVGLSYFFPEIVPKNYLVVSSWT